MDGYDAFVEGVVTARRVRLISFVSVHHPSWQLDACFWPRPPGLPASSRDSSSPFLLRGGIVGSERKFPSIAPKLRCVSRCGWRSGCPGSCCSCLATCFRRFSGRVVSLISSIQAVMASEKSYMNCRIADVNYFRNGVSLQVLLPPRLSWPGTDIYNRYQFTGPGSGTILESTRLTPALGRVVFSC